MVKTYSRIHANRGKKLEMMLEMSNKCYFNSGQADVRKVPPPTDVLSVSGNTVKGKLAKAEWVDYNGIHKGKSIVFEAKESTKPSWSLKNMADHQYKFLESWHRHGALSFVIVCFWLPGVNEPEIYLLMFEQLEQAFKVAASPKGAKSIPIIYFREQCPRLRSRNGVAIDYLAALNLDGGGVSSG